MFLAGKLSAPYGLYGLYDSMQPLSRYILTRPKPVSSTSGAISGLRENTRVLVLHQICSLRYEVKSSSSFYISLEKKRKVKMSKRFSLFGFGTVLFLILGAGVAPMAVANDLSNETHVTISETKERFVFTENATKEELKLFSRISEDEAERSALAFTSEGTPVILNEQFSMPPIDIPELGYEETVKRANEERGAAEGVLPEGESAYEEKWLTEEENNYDPNLLMPHAAFAVEPTAATFRLTHAKAHDSSNYKYFSVFLDQKLVSVHSTPEFVIDGLKPDTEYHYEIVSSEDDPSAKTSQQNGFMASTRMFSFRTPPQTKKQLQSSSYLSTATFNVTNHAYLHTTFIPTEYVVLTSGLENLGCGSLPNSVVAFKGDNRDFATPGPGGPYTMGGYRTYMYVLIGYDLPSGMIAQGFKDVSPTKKYVNGIHTATKTASSVGADWFAPSASSNYTQLMFHHEVGNPFCVTGAITYNEEVQTWRATNTIQVSGWRYPVPNHEISFGFSTIAGPYFLPAVWRGTLDFSCLLGTCPTDNYSQNIAGV